MKKLLALLLLILITYAGYSWYSQRLLPSSSTSRSTVLIDGINYTVALADTDDLRTKGLSGRASLGANQGMLFIFPNKDRPTFWMKDMQFPLDFIWISDDTVVDISENVPVPITATYLLQTERQPRVPVSQVLEINAGDVAKHGFKIGDHVAVSLVKTQSATR